MSMAEWRVLFGAREQVCVHLCFRVGVLVWLKCYWTGLHADIELCVYKLCPFALQRLKSEITQNQIAKQLGRRSSRRVFLLGSVSSSFVCCARSSEFPHPYSRNNAPQRCACCCCEIRSILREELGLLQNRNIVSTPKPNIALNNFSSNCCWWSLFGRLLSGLRPRKHTQLVPRFVVVSGIASGFISAIGSLCLIFRLFHNQNTYRECLVSIVVKNYSSILILYTRDQWLIRDRHTQIHIKVFAPQKSAFHIYTTHTHIDRQEVGVIDYLFVAQVGARLNQRAPEVDDICHQSITFGLWSSSSFRHIAYSWHPLVVCLSAT